MDLRITRWMNRISRMAPMMTSGMDTRIASPPDLSTHSRTAYRANRAMKMYASLTRPWFFIERRLELFQDRLRQVFFFHRLVGVHAVGNGGDFAFGHCRLRSQRLLEDIHGGFGVIREVEQLQIVY